MVNGPDHIYIERKGKIIRVDSFFLNNDHVLRIIDRIIGPSAGGSTRPAPGWMPASRTAPASTRSSRRCR